MNIGKAIKIIRIQKEVSQVELAKLAGITQTTLSQIESGKKRPGEKTLNGISDALGVSTLLLYITGIEKDDVPENRRALYDQLFPVIQSLTLQIAM